jgi:predicted SnoaL-like aldol condensation-catalyzing enzyme
MKLSATSKFLCMAFLASALSAAHAAESLAPPHAPIVEGKPVPVVAHPDQTKLLVSTLPALAANKKLVHEFWRTVIVGGQSDKTADYLTDTFIEHNPLLPTGRTAFQRYVAEHSKAMAVPTTIPDLVSLLAEGPYVVLVLISHYPEPDNSSNTYTSTRFELFRVEQGRIAEHWDSSLFRAGQVVPDYGQQNAVPVTGIAGNAQHALLANASPQLFVNKRLAFDLWRNIPEGGQEDLADLYLAPTYIQHNPNAATGREGFKEYFRRRPDSNVESYLETPLVAMVAEGDLVVQVLQTTRKQNDKTYQVPWFDMFRIENGVVAEHWDTASKGEIPAAVPGGALGL